MNSRRNFLRSLAGGAVAAWGPVAIPAIGQAAEPAIRAGYLPTEAEIRVRSPSVWRLVDLINAYRHQHGLAVINLSPRLSAVAAWHVKDLFHSEPHRTYGSLHSWSRSERWTGGAFQAEAEATWPIMWDKPREIAGYAGYGFEIAAANVRDTDHALEVWQRSASHNDVLLNRNLWTEMSWQAVGAVFYQGYACAWFGVEKDA